MTDTIEDTIKVIPPHIPAFPLEGLTQSMGLSGGKLPENAVLIENLGPNLSAKQTPVIGNNILARLTYGAGFDDDGAKSNAKTAVTGHLVDILTGNAGFDDPDVGALVTASMPYRSPTVMDPLTLLNAIKEMRKDYENKNKDQDTTLSSAMVPRKDILTPDDYRTALAETIYVAKGFLSLAKLPLMKKVIDQEKNTMSDGLAYDILRDGAMILAKKLYELASVSFDFQIAAHGSNSETHYSNLGSVYERFRSELERTVLALRAYVGSSNQTVFDKEINMYSDN